MDEAPGAPSRARTAVTAAQQAARCNRGARAAAHASPLHASFLLLSFFCPPPPFFPRCPLSRPGGGGCCATSRAAVPRERGSPQHPAGPLAAVTRAPPQRKHRRVPSSRAPARRLWPWCELVLSVVSAVGPSRCLNFQGTKFGINSKHLCASTSSPATAKLVSPPYQAARWPTSPVDEQPPRGLMCGRACACAYPRCSTLLPRYELSGRGAFHTREASQFAGGSSEHSVPFPGPLPSVLVRSPGLDGCQSRRPPAPLRGFCATVAWDGPRLHTGVSSSSLLCPLP